ncbi:MAG: ABC transporter permease [Myxococcota bacterium]
MFELFTSWKYIFSPQKKAIILKIFLAGLFILITGLVLFFQSRKTLQFTGVILFSIGCTVSFVSFLLRYFSVFTTISIGSVFLGTTVITVVWSVSSGFQKDFKEKILGVNGHILIMTRSQPFVDYKIPLEIARKNFRVKEAGPFNLNELIAVKGKNHSGILIKGIKPDISKKILDLPKHLIKGKITDLSKNSDYDPAHAPPPPDDSEETIDDSESTGSQINPCGKKDTKWPGLILGKGLTQKLGVKKGDFLTVFSPTSTYFSHLEVNQATQLNKIDFCITGIFYVGFEEYDEKLAYAHIDVTQLFNPTTEDGKKTIFGLEMRLHDMDTAPVVAAQIKQKLQENGYNLRVVTWGQLNPQVFQNLQFHKTVIWILLFFLITVAAFGMLSALYMLVLDKRKEISILKSMGATDFSVAIIFVLSGSLIGAIGLLVGDLLGFILSLMLKIYSFPLDSEVYIISSLPVSIKGENFLMISLVTISLCILATVLPAFKAARTKPVYGLMKNRE